MDSHRTTSLIALAFLVACADAPPPFETVADTRQLMASILEPAAEVYWDAVGTVIDEKGTHEFAPTTEEEWAAVRNSAFVIAEAGNLLMMPGRLRDTGEWARLSRAMMDAGRLAIKAAEAKDKVAVFDVGAQLYDSCTNCHAKYAVDLLRPNAR